MAQTSIEQSRYAGGAPLWEDLPDGHRVRTGSSGSVTVLSGAQVPATPVRMVNHWIDKIPTPNPYVPKHDHEFDEILYFVGSNPDDPDDLGAVIEFEVGDEVLMIERSTAIYIPAGTLHAPMTFHSVTRPLSFLATYLDGPAA